ncbi:glycosyltransferase family 9 protein, partial [Candidatus Desantisbacteria bacterium]|nr:glycosyltransferase family 9 protein [Candidatus Desantisbacteria bacterium]
MNRPQNIDIDTKFVKKILIVRKGALGDVLMITPFIKSVKISFPGSIVDVLTHPKSLVVLQNNPYINEVLTLSHTNPVSFLEHRKIINYIKRQGYDIAFILETKNFYCELVKKGKVKTVIGVSPASDYYYPLHQHKHVIESYLDIVECFSKKTNLSSMMEVFPSDAQKERVNELLGSVKDYIVIHPGTSAVKNRFIKNKYGLRFWGIEKFAQLADWFNSNKNLKVIFTGSKQEDRLIKEIMALMKTEGLNFSGVLSFLELS